MRSRLSPAGLAVGVVSQAIASIGAPASMGPQKSWASHAEAASVAGGASSCVAGASHPTSLPSEAALASEGSSVCTMFLPPHALASRGSTASVQGEEPAAREHRGPPIPDRLLLHRRPLAGRRAPTSVQRRCPYLPCEHRYERFIYCSPRRHHSHFSMIFCAAARVCGLARILTCLHRLPHRFPHLGSSFPCTLCGRLRNR